MIELGKKQTMYVVKKTPLGIFINENPDELINSIVLSNQELERAGDKRKNYRVH